MQVRMVAYRTLQEAGRTLPLSVGETYELAETVALALVASGAAEPAEIAIHEPDETKPDAVPAMVAAPVRETAAVSAPETGRRRRR